MADHHVSSLNYIQDELDSRLARIADYFKSDVITIIGPIQDPMDTVVQNIIESLDPHGPKLSVILETYGGYIEVAERMVTIFRRFYPEVDFIVPGHAMSAGTVLVMSGDAIYMDYSSVLGPIDPQVQSREGRPVPALGYLAKYNDLIARSGQGAGLSSAEITYLVERFDPGELHAFESKRRNYRSTCYSRGLSNTNSRIGSKPRAAANP